jgi:hypothetical protein
MNFFLSIATIGIYGIFWDYQLHTDPDRIYPEFHGTEDAVLSAKLSDLLLGSRGRRVRWRPHDAN